MYRPRSITRLLSQRKREAFTLIELLVVIAIIAILAALLTPAAREALERGRAAVCMSNLHQIALGLAGYMVDHNQNTPPYVEHGSDRRGWRGPDGVRYNQYRRHWHYTAWFKPGPWQGGPRDGDGFLGPYMGGEEGKQYGIMGCPSVYDGEGISTWAGAAFPSYIFHYESLGLNLDATGAYVDGGRALGRYIPGIDDPLNYIIFADTLGMEGAYMNPGLYPAEDYSRHAPIDRHLGRFNAMFLDSHVESVTEESHHSPKFFVRASGS